VIPCLDPVMIMLVGWDAVLWSVTRGRSAQRPLVMPKVFTAKILLKYSGFVQGLEVPGMDVPAV
jgi:hypothetical protein